MQDVGVQGPTIKKNYLRKNICYSLFSLPIVNWITVLCSLDCPRCLNSTSRLEPKSRSVRLSASSHRCPPCPIRIVKDGGRNREKSMKQNQLFFAFRFWLFSMMFIFPWMVAGAGFPNITFKYPSTPPNPSIVDFLHFDPRTIWQGSHVLLTGPLEGSYKVSAEV